MDETRVKYCPVCGEAIDISDGVNTFYVDCSYCGTEFDAAPQEPTRSDWKRWIKRASDGIASLHKQLQKHQNKLGRLVDAQLAASVPSHLHQVMGIGDHCSHCGGTMIGDGITLARHCEQADLPEDREPDAPALYCTNDDKNNKQ